jgi:hypothetical protein
VHQDAGRQVQPHGAVQGDRLDVLAVPDEVLDGVAVADPDDVLGDDRPSSRSAVA